MSEVITPQILTASHLENWRRPRGRPHTKWTKSIQQEPKSKNLSLNEAIDVAKNHPLGRLMSTFGATNSQWCMPRKKKKVRHLRVLLTEQQTESQTSVADRTQSLADFPVLSAEGHTTHMAAWRTQNTIANIVAKITVHDTIYCMLLGYKKQCKFQQISHRILEMVQENDIVSYC